MPAYYNEVDPFCGQWLRNLVAAGLIAPGEVDTRDIRDVSADDLVGFDQCHFFAGIAGWSYALRLAGVPDDFPVWTGSCPCQPFSSATRGRATARDEWSGWRPLIDAARPRVVFGEQVASAGRWFDGVCDDLEEMGYAIGAAILPACSIGADHLRQRVYFAAYADSYSKSRFALHAEVAGLSWSRRDSERVAQTHGLPDRVAALSAFGNAVVPQVAAVFVTAALANEE